MLKRGYVLHVDGVTKSVLVWNNVSEVQQPSGLVRRAEEDGTMQAARLNEIISQGSLLQRGSEAGGGSGKSVEQEWLGYYDIIAWSALGLIALASPLSLVFVFACPTRVK
jgi:hypothetical protein